jgi:hypothetical protein
MKELIRKVLRTTERWVREPRDPMEVERNRFPKYAYGELNAKLLEIESRRRGYEQYTFGVLHAAHLGKALGLPRISVIEFGVAGGKGLISLERAAEEVEKSFGIGIDVYGFDTGVGLPRPGDYRDLPNIYTPNTYAMDHTALKKELKRAKLILGMIEDTLPTFVQSRPAPIGFMSVDVDLYSSTVPTLKLMEAEPDILLPRIHCYFDDIMGFNCSEYNGQRLAIQEFNDSHVMRKISPIYGLRYFVPKVMSENLWVEMIYLAHIFDHPLYGNEDGMVLQKENRLGEN